MIRYVAAAALSTLLLAGRAQAQNNFEGLDLSDDSSKKDDKKKEEDGLDLTTPDKPPPPKKTSGDTPPKKPLAKKEDEPQGERDITQDDRVKSVQRKLYIKRGRVELAPSFVVNINDPYYTRLGGAIRAAFYPADTLAFAARFTYMTTLPTDDVNAARAALSSRVFASKPQWSAVLDAEWSPIYGKVSFANSILHLDGYLIGGGGVVYTETSGSNELHPPINAAFDLGVGLRFVAKDFFAVNLALVNTMYQDTPTGTTKGALQNLMVLQVGFSLFVPFKSTFREAE